MQPGRTCPLSYRYAPSVLARAPELHAETLYIAGGVYGNTFALERILELVHDEPGGAALVFNGDFHWFDVDPHDFESVNATVQRHVALRGNVETEIAHDDAEAGCGCAYPESVSEAEVARSNAIVARLRDTARGWPAARAWLGALPMHSVAEVAGVRIAIVHGDAESLAGWSYSAAALRQKSGLQRLREDFAASRARIIASSHTCLPVAVGVDAEEGACALFNNGAAGMPNFRGTRYGLVTRISSRPARRSLYRSTVGGACVEAIAVEYDHDRWVERFVASWPAGSPARASYFERIMQGPNYDIARALKGSVSITV